MRTEDRVVEIFIAEDGEEFFCDEQCRMYEESIQPSPEELMADALRELLDAIDTHATGSFGQVEDRARNALDLYYQKES